MRKDTTYSLTGQVKDRSGQATGKLRAEIWNMSTKKPSLLGRVPVDERGEFNITFTEEKLKEANRIVRPEIEVKIYTGGKLMTTKMTSIKWERDEKNVTGGFTVDIFDTTRSRTLDLQIGSLQELVKHEDAILKIMESMPNGGMLFLLDPMRFFKDIGVHLDEKTFHTLKSKYPKLIEQTKSNEYLSLKKSKVRHKVRFSLTRLFEEDEL